MNPRLSIPMKRLSKHLRKCLNKLIALVSIGSSFCKRLISFYHRLDCRYIKGVKRWLFDRFYLFMSSVTKRRACEVYYRGVFIRCFKKAIIPLNIIYSNRITWYIFFLNKMFYYVLIAMVKFLLR